MNYNDVLRMAERIAIDIETMIDIADFAPAWEKELVIEVIKALANTYGVDEELGL